eukprot:768755-Hanusia_phi.AAC.1
MALFCAGYPDFSSLQSRSSMELDNEVSDKIQVHVEAVLVPKSSAAPADMKKRVESFLTTRHASFSNGAISFSEDPILAANLSGLQICDVELDSRVTGGAVPVWQSELRVHVVQLDTEGAVDESDEEVTSCQIWMLPSKDFHGLWESLIYDFDVKRNLLDYAQTAMFFSDRSGPVICHPSR